MRPSVKGCKKKSAWSVCQIAFGLDPVDVNVYTMFGSCKPIIPINGVVSDLLE